MKYIEHNGCKLTIHQTRYVHGGLALQLLESGQPYATATINPPSVVKLKENEVAIKDYSENTGILLALQQAGIIGPVKHSFQSGFVSIPVCDYYPEIAKEFGA